MSNLLIDEQPLMVMPKLATKIGLNEAIILQQIHYWNKINKQNNNNFKDGYHWVYNTYDQWQIQFPFWSGRTIKRTISNLEKEGYLLTGNYNKLQIDRTKWYRIDYKKLKELENVKDEEIDKNKGRKEEKEPETKVRCHSDKVAQWTGQSGTMDEPFCPHGRAKMSPPLPEITPEITSEITLREREEEINNTKSLPQKDSFGEFKNVKLFQEDLNALEKEYGSKKIKEYITKLDLYIAEKGNKSKSHYATIKKWISEDTKKEKTNHTYKKDSLIFNNENRNLNRFIQ